MHRHKAVRHRVRARSVEEVVEEAGECSQDVEARWHHLSSEAQARAHPARTLHSDSTVEG